MATFNLPPIYHKVAAAIHTIESGQAKRVDVENGVTVYKVPSANPDKYTIRIDVKKGSD